MQVDHNWLARVKLAVEVGHLSGSIAFAIRCLERNEVDNALMALRGAVDEAKKASHKEAA